MECDKIILTHVYPPIPTRSHDWLAYPDGHEENTFLQGWGRTRAEALRDLADRIDDSEEIDREEVEQTVDPDSLHDYPECYSP